MDIVLPCDHPTTVENLYQPSGRAPQCRRCRADRAKELRARRKAGVAAGPYHPMAKDQREIRAAFM